MRFLMNLIFYFMCLMTPLAFSANPTAILAISDLHFDPYAACKGDTPCSLIQQLQKAPITQWDALLKQTPAQPSTLGQDTNYALWQSTLSELQSRNRLLHPAFILLLGDLLAHDYRENYFKFTAQQNAADYRQFVRKTFHYLTQTLSTRFPQTDIYAALGNNDTYADHFDLTTQNAVTRDLSQWLGSALHHKNRRVQFTKQFNQRGFYTLLLPTDPPVRLIALNSTPFARQAKPDLTLQKAQLHFLHRALTHASKQHEKVFIVMHIPNNIDVYSSLKKSLMLQWQEKPSQQFNQELKDHAADIIGIFAAHTHSDWFGRLQSIPIIGVNSISPQHNAPGYKVITYTQQLLNYQTYHYRNNTWQLAYDFNQLYQVNNPNSGLTYSFSHLNLQGTAAHSFQTFFEVDHQPSVITGQNWRYYACNIGFDSLSAYKKCLMNQAA